MGIDRSDCISITEKTFDLTLEDSYPQSHVPNTDNLLDHQVLEDQSEKVSVDVINSDYYDVPKHLQSKTTTSTLSSNYTTTYDKAALINTKNKALVDYLNYSIKVLNRICGTGSENNELVQKDDDDLVKMGETISKLSDNSEVKLMFYEKNYKFLEGLYDSIVKENKIEKMKLETKENELKELQVKYDKLKKIMTGSKHHEHQLRAPLTPTQTNQQMSVLKEEELNKRIERQQQEIREYKRFIKELMGRE